MLGLECRMRMFGPAFWAAMAVASSVLLNGVQLSRAADLSTAKVRLRVVDQKGQPVPAFEARIRSLKGESHWKKGQNGALTFSNHHVADLLHSSQPDALLNVEIEVRSAASSSCEHFADRDLAKLLAGETRIVLPEDGPAVRLRFHLPAGLTLPKDFRPQVYSANDRDEVQMGWMIRAKAGTDDSWGLMRVRPSGPGEFELALAHPDQPFYVAIFRAGFLRYFERGPLRLADLKDRSVEIAIDRPATLAVRFDPGSQEPATRPFDYPLLTVERTMEGSRPRYIYLTADFLFDSEERATDLAAGEYTITIQTHARSDVKNLAGPSGSPGRLRLFASRQGGRIPVNPGVFVETKKVMLASGQTQRVDIHYRPLDPNVFRGNRTAILKFAKGTGEPTAGKRVWVGYLDPGYGPLPVFDSTAGPSGEVVLKDITDRVLPGVPRKPYLVWAGEEMVGGFSFASKATSETFRFTLPFGAGDMSPDVELIGVATGKPVKLSSFRGKIVCLDFWATWCGPCQRALKELDQLGKAKASAWKDRVVIIPVSIDDEAQKVPPHLTKTGWTHLEHYWAGPKAFESAAAQSFAVRGIPTSFLIAPDGRILWSGHPLASDKTIEERIEEALRP